MPDCVDCDRSSDHARGPVAERKPPGRHLRRYVVAYVLLLTVGWTGAHRHYLRKPVSGLLYAATLGYMMLGVFADDFLLPSMIRQSLTPGREHFQRLLWLHY